MFDFNPVSKIEYYYLSKLDNTFKKCIDAFDCTMYQKYGYIIKVVNAGLTKDYLL